MFLTGPISTSLCERLGCRPVAVLGGLIAALGTMLASFSTDIYKMYLTYGFLFGVGASMCYFPSVIILPQYFNKQLSLTNGLVSCGSGVGTMVMGPVMQLLLDTFGWVNTIRFCSGAMILVTMVSLVYRPRIPPIPPEIAKTRPLFDVSVFKNKAYIMFVIALSFFMLAYFVPFVHLVSHHFKFPIPDSSLFLCSPPSPPISSCASNVTYLENDILHNQKNAFR